MLSKTIKRCGWRHRAASDCLPRKRAKTDHRYFQAQLTDNVKYPWMSEAHEMPASTRLNFEGSGEQVLGFNCALLLYILLSPLYCAHCPQLIYKDSDRHVSAYPNGPH
jgi:hypothetical protein